jgi:RNA polymerase sigma factor (sigma-70 family)
MKPSFDELFATYSPTIQRLVRSTLAPGSAREDLNQEIWLAIFRALPHFRGASSIRTYVLRIAHNRCISHIVRKRVLWPIEDLDALQDGGSDPEETSGQRQDVERLFASIRRLPLGQRHAITLLMEGMSHAQIAECLGITENNVAVRIHRARAHLRRTMGDTNGPQ